MESGPSGPRQPPQGIGPIAPVNRHRGESHLSSPATPPNRRVPHTAVRQVSPSKRAAGWRSKFGDAVRVSLLGLASVAASRAGPTQGLPKQDSQCSTLIETQALLTLPIVRAFTAPATTTPSADFCGAVRTPLDVLSHDRRPHHPVLVHRPTCLLRASFRPHLAVTPLRFAITSPPSGCEEDFHLQAVRTCTAYKQKAGLCSPPGLNESW